MESSKRIVWIDWMRVIAFFLVLVVHSTEPFYFGGKGCYIAGESDMYWIAFFEALARSCVPLFVIASGYLLFPLRYDAVTFAKKRAVRILVPFVIWSLFYAFYWGEPVSNLKGLLLNFNYTAGHLWFVYMLIGLYIMMPLLSPWAEKVGKKELGIYIGIWLATTLVPLVRDAVSGHEFTGIYGPTGIPNFARFPLWGECSWNVYGSFYYISGLIGYLFVGLWLRKFGSGITDRQAFAAGIPCFAAGALIVGGGFIRRVLASAAGSFPVDTEILEGAWWETTWGYDSFGVAIMTIGAILMTSRISADGKFYRRIISPVSKASYGMYLGHMAVLAEFSGLFKGAMPVPCAIICTAVCSAVVVSIAGVLLQRIPKIGKYIIG